MKTLLSRFKDVISSFSDIVTFYRKAAVLLKLSKANYPGFFISTAKI